MVGQLIILNEVNKLKKLIYLKKSEITYRKL